MNQDPILIITGGDDAPPTRPLPQARFVIAADSGLDLATRLALTVDVIVGDFDSADSDAVGQAVAGGASLERHSPDKDASDLELALDHARTLGGGTVIVIGGARGDRLDHLLATAGLLGSNRFEDLAIEWWSGSSRAVVTRGTISIDGKTGDIVSIVPAGGPVTVSIVGVRWPLDGVTLPHGSTTGISNEITAPPAVITVTTGTAFVLHEGK